MPTFEINEFPWQRADAWRPQTTVDLTREGEALRLRFVVQDAFVLGRTQDFNGRVWEDSCVEFFFNPCPGESDFYFNIETNIAGGILFNRQTGRGENTTVLSPDVAAQMELTVNPGELIVPEDPAPREWSVEYLLPFAILREFGPVNPHVWHANFYKCAEANSHPHWGSWARIGTATPYFHSPNFFAEVDVSTEQIEAP
ncbi:MAG: hypothetical protein JNJ45_02645 [Chthonomonas sp.]|nr:hypothetical protein [Chthonomonas sp.]